MVAQQTDLVDFQKIEAIIEPLSSQEKIEGTFTVSFKMLQKADAVYLDAKNMTLHEDLINYDFSTLALKNKILFVKKGGFQKDTIYKTHFNYSATPKQALYFNTQQIWTQGQGKYTSHWLPSIDDMNDKIEFDLKIVAPLGQTAIANGKLLEQTTIENATVWHYDMQKPMSSYLVAFAIGNYRKKKVEAASGIPIELYYELKDSLKFEPTYRYTKDIFDFIETEIGMAYPWQNYKQVPIRDFLYAGMENTSCTLFSEAFVVDSIGFKDRNYVNVNAHELAHQWFGNLVTETDGKHHWLHEGFATYYALLTEKELFGEDYYYWKLYNSAEQLKAISDQGKGQSLLDPKASSLTFYEKGAWAIHILKETIGALAFKQAILNYLENNKFKNVTTEDFIAEVRKVTPIDISNWKKNWLQQTAFKAEEAYQSLMNSKFMQQFFQVSALRATPLKEKFFFLLEAIKMNNDFIGQEVVYQLSNEAFVDTEMLYKEALKTDNVFIRQSIALSMDKIPKSFQVSYESLLTDASYLTQEAALYNLWQNFPDKRKEYLDAMHGVEGFQNKNIRQLWLTLALYTQSYEEAKKGEYLNELKNYTSPTFSFEIREKAFEYLYPMGVMDAQVIKNLVQSCTHHYWRFRDSARAILDDFLKQKGSREKIMTHFMSYSDSEKAYITKKFQLK